MQKWSGNPSRKDKVRPRKRQDSQAFEIREGFRAEFSLTVEVLRTILEGLEEGQTEVIFSMDSKGKVRYQGR